MQSKEKQRILKKIDEMDKYLDELEYMLPNESDFFSDLVKKRASEKTIELAIEALIDSCFMVVSAEKLGIASDEENIFDILAKRKVITMPLCLKLKNMKGFRNILIHRYGELNDQLVYDFLVNNLHDFEEYKKQILGCLKVK